MLCNAYDDMSIFSAMSKHQRCYKYMWYLWILTKAIVMLCLSLPTTKAYVELIGVENSMKEHTCNAYIVKSNLGSKDS